MPAIEKKLFAFCTRHRFGLLMFLALAASLALRVLLFPYVSSDMAEFLLPWVEEIRRYNGLEALAQPIGNYPTSYMLLLLLASKLPVDTMLVIKLYSVLADYGMALVAGLIVRHFTEDTLRGQRWAVLAGVLTALLPLPIFNSALWGQCDSIYTLFLLLAVYFALKNHWTAAVLMLGVSFAFKLQAVFLLPFFLIAYVGSRRFSLLNFLAFPLPVFLFSLPGSLQNGNFLLALDVYRGQAEGDDRLFNDYFNFSVLFNNVDPPLMKKFMIAFMILVFFLMFAFVWGTGARLEGETLLLLAGWSAITCVMLLPNMHERYGFVGEMLLWLWFMARPSLRRAVPAGIFMLTALAAYMSFLGGYWVFDVNLFSLLNMAAYAWLGYELLQAVRRSPRHAPEETRRKHRRPESAVPHTYKRINETERRES